ncbi:TRAP transporter large permease [Salipiger bermudensis]|uniref:TRAP transporter large permease protein n=2 Tax=Salipiger TaxID=263377 RepID=Q0FMF5_SALBH|nr:TRAP transporter large permease [Salipiger bermudensis]MAE92287.1 TRAP transporter large permease [Pelagibaca sp.]MBR9893260.1 TRAP transporter large permease [bacterium]EAU45443.1 DctMQ fusion protein (C4-dicarboxylate transporter) [Salipiger bermudensis HTCC2601]MBN9677788.1 TRAP transporter large permease [Salipiger bermudensis]MCA1287734.1 TRAP transporter large permease [Salipiger bermudensis]
MIWAGSGFLLLLVSGIPIVLALGIAALVAIEFTTTAPISIVAQRVYGGISSFTLMAIPFFVASGLLMEAGGIARRFVNLAGALVGWITGSLYLVSIVTGTGLAAISGSGSADTAAISAVMTPEMRKRGYDIDLASAVIAASGSLASVIPPSIVMIVIAITANQSIGAMFLGGIVPGLLVMTGLMLGCWLFAKRGGEAYRDREPFTLGRLGRSFLEAVPGMLVPVVILGGIVGGVFTATEAACVALFTTLIVTMFIYREITVRDLPRIFLRAISLSATVLIIVATASVFTWIIATQGFPAMLRDWLTGVTSNPVAFLLIVNVLLLVVGMFMESISAVLILLPILLPIAQSYGINPVQFGVITALNLSIGLITPPYGICLYVASTVAGRRIEQVSRKVWLPLGCMLVALMLVTFVPAISLWLPSVLL